MGGIQERSWSARLEKSEKWHITGGKVWAMLKKTDARNST